MPRPGGGGANGVTAFAQGGQVGAAPIILVSVEDGDGRDEDGVAPAAAADDAAGRWAAAAAAASARARVLRRAGASACAALSLGVLGSTVFPIPFAVSRTGLLSAALTMLVVAAANDATCGWLVDAAAATGHSSYEALALWAGGPRLRAATQLSLIALLWGTMVAGLCLIADTGRMALSHVFAPAASAAADAAAATAASGTGAAVVAAGGGRLVMLCVSAFVLFPLCLQRRMRELEAAGAAGGVLVLGLVALLLWRAAKAGWAGFADVPVWSLAAGDPALLPEAFAIFATAFYMQPMLLPLVRDMPGVEAGAGRGGEAVAAAATTTGAVGAGEGGGGARAAARGIAGQPSPLSAKRPVVASADGRHPITTTTTTLLVDAAAAADAGAGAGADAAGDVTATQGLAALRGAVRVTLYFVAVGVYLGVGAFGAGAFGAGTHGNVLTNDVLDEGWGDEKSAGPDPPPGGDGVARGGGGGGGGRGAAPPFRAAVARPKRAAAATLYALVLLYLALGMTTTLFALRASLDIAIFGAAGADVGADAPVRPLLGDSDDDDDDEDEDEEEDNEETEGGGGRRRPKSPLRRRRHDDTDAAARPLRPGFTWPRHVLLTASSIASAACVACLLPRAAEKVYAVVGATGVCAVSYVIPAVLKVQLYRERAGLVHRAGAGGHGARGATEGPAAAGAAAAPRAPRVVVAASLARQRRPPSASGGGPALLLPLLDPWAEQQGQMGARAYIFGAAHVGVPSSSSLTAAGGGGGGSGAGAGGGGAAAGLLLDDALAGLVAPNALLTPPPPAPPPPPPPPPPLPRVAVRRDPAAPAAVAPRHRAPPRKWRLLPSLEGVPAGPARRARLREMAREVGLPLAVALFGVTSSAAALIVAVRQAFLAPPSAAAASPHGGENEATVHAMAAALGRFVEANILA